MKEAEIPWIEVGYRLFAYDGPGSLKVERLAKAVKKSKSSFYHLFADLEVFTQRLLDYHFEQAKIVVHKEATAKSEAELISVIVEHKVDLLFNRQLRIHRENPDFENCFCKINAIAFPAMMPIWKEIIGLTDNSSLAEMVLSLSIENFYLQITDTTLNEPWLTAYFKNIRNMISQFKLRASISELDGTV
ncbi:MAG: TetR/AcrR family transcriptional regulator [Bacteroidota bacterium]